MMCIMHSGSLRRPLPTEGCFRYGEMNRPGGSVEGHQVQFILYGWDRLSRLRIYYLIRFNLFILLFFYIIFSCFLFVWCTLMLFWWLYVAFVWCSVTLGFHCVFMEDWMMWFHVWFHFVRWCRASLCHWHLWLLYFFHVLFPTRFEF